MSSLKIIRNDELAQELGVSKTTLWRMQQRNELPRPLKLSKRLTGWRRSQIEKWLEDKEKAMA